MGENPVNFAQFGFFELDQNRIEKDKSNEQEICANINPQWQLSFPYLKFQTHNSQALCVLQLKVFQLLRSEALRSRPIRSNLPSKGILQRNNHNLCLIELKKLLFLLQQESWDTLQSQFYLKGSKNFRLSHLKSLPKIPLIILVRREFPDKNDGIMNKPNPNKNIGWANERKNLVMLSFGLSTVQTIIQNVAFIRTNPSKWRVYWTISDLFTNFANFFSTVRPSPSFFSKALIKKIPKISPSWKLL